jgi:cell fate regulator YaaT (PSP1 superfamily)
MLGGLGVCGRPFCCSSFLGDFQPVSIKMAKDQGLSLNLSKISGTCGRLMCCLKYEQSVYDELLKQTPRVGSIVSTKDGKGTVCDVSLLKGNLRVKFEGNDDSITFGTYHKDDVKVIHSAKKKPENEEYPEGIEE